MKKMTNFAIILFQCLPALGLYIGGSAGSVITYASAWVMIVAFTVIATFFMIFIAAYTGAINDLEEDIYDKTDFLADKLAAYKKITVPLWRVVIIILASVCTAMLQFYLTSGILLIAGFSSILAVKHSIKISKKDI